MFYYIFVVVVVLIIDQLSTRTCQAYTNLLLDKPLEVNKLDLVVSSWKITAATLNNITTKQLINIFLNTWNLWQRNETLIFCYTAFNLTGDFYRLFRFSEFYLDFKFDKIPESILSQHHILFCDKSRFC